MRLANERVVAVDTRGFKNPAGGDAGEHIGFHAAVVIGIVKSHT